MMSSAVITHVIAVVPYTLLAHYGWQSQRIHPVAARGRMWTPKNAKIVLRPWCNIDSIFGLAPPGVRYTRYPHVIGDSLSLPPL